MLSYYLNLALRSLKRNTVLTALMVLAIALGIGASMTTLTVWHALSGDPLPGKSAKVFRVQLDPRDRQGYRPGVKPPDQVTWIDGMNLLHANRGKRQALMTAGNVSVYPARASIEPFFEGARFTSAGFFPMFEVPFLYGHAWRVSDDRRRARVVVISRQLNARLFNGDDSTGKMLNIGNHDLQIVGVLDTWRPSPRFYDLSSGSYRAAASVFLPLSTSRDLKYAHSGDTDCWGKGSSSEEMLETASCTWLQFWVELDAPAKAAEYRQFLVHYSQQQKALGRFQRPPNIRLSNVMQWLDAHDVLPGSVLAQAWLAFGFLLVCLVNTVGLLLAKFLRRAGALGVRRAMGASRWTLFAQLLVESGVVGVLGGAFGLSFACLGLWFVRRQPTEYADLAQLDPFMLLTTIAAAIAASLIAGILPAWRACRITPAVQLKGS